MVDPFGDGMVVDGAEELVQQTTDVVELGARGGEWWTAGGGGRRRPGGGGGWMASKRVVTLLDSLTVPEGAKPEMAD